jgi:hypothetical protein
MGYNIIMMTEYEKSIIRTYVDSFLIALDTIEIPSEYFYANTIEPWVKMGHDPYEVGLIAQNCVEDMLQKGFMERQWEPNTFKITNIRVPVPDWELTKEDRIRLGENKKRSRVK